MRLSFVLLILATLASIHFARACEPAESQNGCKIYGASCTCGYGCKSEFMYRSRRACLSALRERSSNVCYRLPCLRGICIQTVQEPGYTCKCEGTGFFGFRCEKGRRNFVSKCMSRLRGIDFQTVHNSDEPSKNGDDETRNDKKGNGAVQLCRLVYAHHSLEFFDSKLVVHPRYT